MNLDSRDTNDIVTHIDTTKMNDDEQGDASSSNLRNASKEMMPLAPDFEPGKFDVIIGRGKVCYAHSGNERFREIVESYVDRYSGATSRQDKSDILSAIVDEVRKSSPNGGFVKKEPDTGKWVEVGDFLAREKTSQAFRDALSSQYRSSKKFKHEKRRQRDKALKASREQGISSHHAAPLSTPSLDTATTAGTVTHVSRDTMHHAQNVELLSQQQRLLRNREQQSAMVPRSHSLPGIQNESHQGYLRHPRAFSFGASRPAGLPEHINIMQPVNEGTQFHANDVSFSESTIQSTSSAQFHASTSQIVNMPILETMANSSWSGPFQHMPQQQSSHFLHQSMQNPATFAMVPDIQGMDSSARSDTDPMLGRAPRQQLSNTSMQQLQQLQQLQRSNWMASAMAAQSTGTPFQFFNPPSSAVANAPFHQQVPPTAEAFVSHQAANQRHMMDTAVFSSTHPDTPVGGENLIDRLASSLSEVPMDENPFEPVPLPEEADDMMEDA